MLAPLAFAAGATYAAIRSNIRPEVEKLTSLVMSGGLDEKSTARAKEIIEASKKRGWTGRWLNNEAYETLCRLCREERREGREGEHNDAELLFRDILRDLRRKLRCAKGQFV